jgi:hypothetical protein
MVHQEGRGEENGMTRKESALNLQSIHTMATLRANVKLWHSHLHRLCTDVRHLEVHQIHQSKGNGEEKKWRKEGKKGGNNSDINDDDI